MRIAVERLLRSPGERHAERNRSLVISGNRVATAEEASPGEGRGLLAMPAPANAHDHARAVKPAALGALELPLELWLAAVTGAPRVDPYVIAAVALGRSVLGGQGAVMMHYMRPQGAMSLVDEARVAPSINVTMFPNTKYGSRSNNWYWASHKARGNDIAAWARRVVRMRDGRIETDERNDLRTPQEMAKG